MPTYDVIVIGAGGFGSGVLYHLARRGVRVLGLEQYGIAHDRGSSHGETRIIRRVYFEHPDYVPLMHRAYELWRELETESGRTLYDERGMITAGPEEGIAITGSLAAAKLHALPIEHMTGAEANARFPGFCISEEDAVVFEPVAGTLAVEACVTAHLERALAHGAELHPGETVREWRADGSGVEVRTDRSTYRAARLVITAGPWAASLLHEISSPPLQGGVRGGQHAEIRVPLRVLRKVLFWHPALAGSPSPRSPVFFCETPAGDFYGHTMADGLSFKVGQHSGEELVPDPAAVDRGCHPRDTQPIQRFLEQHLPAVGREHARYGVCMYTMSPDGHFLIDRHPDYPQVAFGAGFSGHGFKFTGVLGQALAELALDGRTDLPVDFLSLRRFASP